MTWYRSLGVTGTQLGGNEAQLEVLAEMLAKEVRQYYDAELYFHHGDCIGADAQAHVISYMLGFRIVIHPPDKPNKRAFCPNAFMTKEPKPYLVRNKDIVNDIDRLFVVPCTMHEEIRSGTWSTYRYAKKNNVPYVIIFPDGTFSDSVDLW